MKWLIASDIHGSALYCRKLMEAFELEKADRILLLGDLLYHGPRNDLPDEYNPKEVISFLNDKADKILCVRGNCEAEVDQMVLNFPVMADYVALSFGEKLMFASHGHLYNEEKPLSVGKGNVFICGHTHIPVCNEKDGVIFMNPGSVSIPKGDSFHSYMILENNKFEWKNLLDNKTYKGFDWN